MEISHKSSKLPATFKGVLKEEALGPGVLRLKLNLKEKRAYMSKKNHVILTLITGPPALYQKIPYLFFIHRQLSSPFL